MFFCRFDQIAERDDAFRSFRDRTGRSATTRVLHLSACPRSSCIFYSSGFALIVESGFPGNFSSSCLFVPIPFELDVAIVRLTARILIKSHRYVTCKRVMGYKWLGRFVLTEAVYEALAKLADTLFSHADVRLSSHGRPEAWQQNSRDR